MDQKRFTYVGLTLIVLVLICVAAYFAFIKKTFPFVSEPDVPALLTNNQTPVEPANKTDCENHYNEIENDLDKANYCQVDSDCDVLVLGGEYVKFGCYHFVNKKVDKNKFYEKIKRYDQRCNNIINDCAPNPKPSCVSNKCVFRGNAGY